MASHQAESNVPLTEKDEEALEAIFEKLEVEEIHHIEATAAYYTAAPLEPWEEIGWVINSSFVLASEAGI